MGDVVGLDEIGRDSIDAVGGKAAALGELCRMGGVRVPAGFCVTTHAFRRVVADTPMLCDLITRLDRITSDHDAAPLAARIRAAIREAVIPDDVDAAIDERIRPLGVEADYAVRSSATAEDLPGTSFAGQYESYLGVVGPEAIRGRVKDCWASLFGDRAVAYRAKHRISHGGAAMAVVIQRMVPARAAGVLFTADPVTSNRTITAIEAVRGLGDTFATGHADADSFRVRSGRIIHAAPAGARSAAAAPEPDGQAKPSDNSHPYAVLADTQAIELAEIGRRIEAGLGDPQDIEWCLADDRFSIVQSRPITTLFPIPHADDDEKHVYVSVGHQQMMTDAIKPLGLSIWQLTTPRRMAEAGGRLFVDVAPILASPAARRRYLDMFAKSDPLIVDALQSLLDRGDVIRTVPDEGPGEVPPGDAPADIVTDPSIVTDLIAGRQAAHDVLEREIAAVSGPELFDYIRADLGRLQQELQDRSSVDAIMAGMQADWWLREHLRTWLGDARAVDRLTLSVPHDVTAQMGLALLDVADVIRPHREVVAALESACDDEGPGATPPDIASPHSKGPATVRPDAAGLFERLASLPGGRETCAALREFLDTYGMRGDGEIDITRLRWAEDPVTLLPALLGNIRHAEPGAAARRFDRGRRLAEETEARVLARLRELPDGAARATDTKRMIDRLRTFAGYREYPKYAMIRRYYTYKRALLREADGLVRRGILAAAEDAFHLRFDEFHHAVRRQHVDHQLIADRKEDHRRFRTLLPPRVLTSEGEVLNGTYRQGAPEGSLPGLSVSAGTVEGRARVVTDPARAELAPGDILVTTFTDPSWTPLFVGIAGLVTEVGGMMAHGAVVAREYGLPAVVGVHDATRLIPDGARIRVDGAGGYVDILGPSVRGRHTAGTAGNIPGDMQ